MNREIKFRAFSNVTKQMYWFDIMNGNRHNTGAGYISMTPFGEPITKPNGLYKDNMIPVDPNDCEIMQFTGLHDKNGKEIYEGDIVKCVYKSSEGGGWYSKSKEQGVVFFDTHWGVKFDLRDGTQRMSKHWKSEIPHTDFSDVEIIGNKYQNPELTK